MKIHILPAGIRDGTPEAYAYAKDQRSPLRRRIEDARGLHDIRAAESGIRAVMRYEAFLRSKKI